MNGTLNTALTACILCGSVRLRCAVPLAPMPIATPNFALAANVCEAEARAGVPLDLYQCDDCGHVQVGVVGNPEVQYREYVYETSLSVGLDEHFDGYVSDVMTALQPVPNGLVVEVGSNDGTLLAGFARAGMRIVGVDPARRIAQAATARGVPTIGEYFTVSVAEDIRRASGEATLVIANNVIANVADLATFARAVELLLAPDGSFVFETQYGADVVERALIDTIYHEHISYMFAKPTRRWLAAYGLEMFDIVPVDTKGGSFRVFAQKAGGPRPIGAAVERWVAREERAHMFDQPFFDRLSRRVAALEAELHTLIDAERHAGGRVGGFGASVGTATLIAQFHLEQKIDFIVDDDPAKEPYFAGPGYRIPVLRGDRLADCNARLIVVFAWRYMALIRRRHARFLNIGGRFVVPLPSVTVEHAEAAARAVMPR